MSQAARFGDLCTGHECWEPRRNDQGSPNVFINGLQAHRQTDHWVVHFCDDDYHESTLCNGSPTVFTNNLQQGRVGDPVCCGSRIAQGSPDVFVGG